MQGMTPKPKKGSDAFEIENRKQIFEYIKSHPGNHLREIQRKLNIPLGTLEYHLRYLVEIDLIVEKEDGHYRRYYPQGTIGSRDKKILSMLNQPIPRKILMYLLLHPNSNFKEIAKNFSESPSTISFHVDKLIKSELIKKEKLGREMLYSVTDEQSVAKMLITYKQSFLDSLVESFVETWCELHP